ncbi:uracil-DNA glycosylase family protein [uncultured Xylophilus sp.]|uniref:uracil-DNA glycosylase family protein n=1 Tax=uncultured Xylophilus sp. TaxID=296832 RepID=UPI0025D5EF56|nr:uracil-DNA glycosylase family protein [uncultured Xylophilus sp.]
MSGTTAAGLVLDDRQRAMLQEMGVTVWLPRTAPATAEPQPAADVAPAPVARTPADVPRPAEADAAPRVPNAAFPAPAPARVPQPAPALQPSPIPGTAPVVALAWEALADPPPAGDAAPLWLVLAEGIGDSLRHGDAGRLLDAMLRAARLPQRVRLQGALVRRAPDGSADGTAPADALDVAVARERPAMVLAMGRLAAQAVLASGEPLGRLRGRVHDRAGVPVVATYDACYLLRAQADKARAWEDLCRALDAAPPG